jgi:riboflavin biosynthesis pyrimidine reductase
MTRPDYTSLNLPDPPADRPYVLVNMVMSVDGKVVIEGTEKGIGSAVDAQLMRELRVNVDVVLSGSGTLRATGVSSRLGDVLFEDLRESRGKKRVPLSAIISRSGRLPLDRAFFTARDFDGLVYLSTAAPAHARAEIAATGRPIVEVPEGDELRGALRHMRKELGAAALLVEGGPNLNTQLFAQGLVDEYFVTLGPVIVGGRDSLTAVEGAIPFPRDAVKRLTLVSAVPNQATHEVYLRYRVRH